VLAATVVGALTGHGIAAQQKPRLVVVVFEDGESVEIRDWRCRYTWTVDVGQTFYRLGELTSNDLMLEVERKTERGVTSTVDRTFPATNLAGLKYDLNRTDTQNVWVKGVTLSLVDGETFYVPWALAPSAKLLTPKNPEAKNHRIVLEGRATLGGREGSFSKDLSPRSFLSGNTETVREVRFQLSASKNE